MIVGYLNRYGCQVVMYVYIHCDAQYVKGNSRDRHSGTPIPILLP